MKENCGLFKKRIYVTLIASIFLLAGRVSEDDNKKYERQFPH